MKILKRVIFGPVLLTVVLATFPFVFVEMIVRVLLMPVFWVLTGDGGRSLEAIWFGNIIFYVKDKLGV